VLEKELNIFFRENAKALRFDALIKRADYFRARLVCQDDKDKRKYHFVKWAGGLSVINLGIMNKALLAKWFWKLETEESIWQTIIKNKYVKGNCISSVKHKLEILISGLACWKSKIFLSFL
jgi:hypothetical protein